jgi:uncharacterized protein (TIGR02117 family)
MKLLKLIQHTALAILALISVYISLAIILSSIPRTRDIVHNGDPDKQITVYLISNGVHLDFVLPKKTPVMDWTRDLQIPEEIEPLVEYIGFGWGDREFYLNTPGWSDLTLQTAFHAAFTSGPSAMHITCYRNPSEAREFRKIVLDTVQYSRLVSYIEESYRKEGNISAVLIPGRSYGKYDQFYEANRSYSLFFTCNTWVNRGLLQCGLKACLWTPFAGGILKKY